MEQNDKHPIITSTPISQIQIGDTVEWNGKHITISKSNLPEKGSFGWSFYGINAHHFNGSLDRVAYPKFFGGKFIGYQ